MKAMKSVLGTTLLASLVRGLPELTLSKQGSRRDGATVLARRNVADRDARHAVGTTVFTAPGWDDYLAYYVNLTVGTPPQTQTVQLDTGSSDLWFIASNASGCGFSRQFAMCRGGPFNSTTSTTFQEVAASPAFNITYVDGSGASGSYGSDSIGLGSVSISDVQFGVGQDLQGTVIGIAGIGYSTNEAASMPYPNLVDSMVDAGVINSRLYSVYLNTDPNSGTILFGGIDTSKYTGHLTAVDLIPSDPSTTIIDEFMTVISGASATIGGETLSLRSGGPDDISAYSGNNSIPGVLDTGTTMWAVPPTIFGTILQLFPYVDDQGLCLCTEIPNGDSFNLTFGSNAHVTINTTEFFLPLGNGSCQFVVGSIGDDHLSLIGDPILRSMYVVFDLDNGQVSIAQAAKNASEPSNIVEVPAGPHGVASAVSVVTTAPANTWSIAPLLTATAGNVASTLVTPIGTATGIDAVPLDGRLNSTTTISALLTSLSTLFTTSRSTSSSQPSTLSTRISTTQSSSGTLTTTASSSRISTASESTHSSVAASTSSSVTEPLSGASASGHSSTASPTSSGSVMVSVSGISTPSHSPATAPTSSSVPEPFGSGTCAVDGALVCNGETEFGLCNFGSVVWQKVAPGTGCIGGMIVGTGIYAVPEETSDV